MCIRYEAKYAFNETVLIDINGSVTPSQSASAAAASPAAAAAPAAAPATAVPSDHAVTITCAAPRPSCLFLQSNFHPPPPDIIWIASVCRIPTAT